MTNTLRIRTRREAERPQSSSLRLTSSRRQHSQQRLRTLLGLLFAVWVAISAPLVEARLRAQTLLATCGDLFTPKQPTDDAPAEISAGPTLVTLADGGIFDSTTDSIRVTIRSQPGIGNLAHDSFTRKIDVALSSPIVRTWEDAVSVAAPECLKSWTRFPLTLTPEDVFIDFSEAPDASTCTFDHIFSLSWETFRSAGVGGCGFTKANQVQTDGSVMRVYSGRVQLHWADYDTLDSSAKPIYRPAETFFDVEIAFAAETMVDTGPVGVTVATYTESTTTETETPTSLTESATATTATTLVETETTATETQSSSTETTASETQSTSSHSRSATETRTPSPTTTSTTSSTSSSTSQSQSRTATRTSSLTSSTTSESATASATATRTSSRTRSTSSTNLGNLPSRRTTTTRPRRPTTTTVNPCRPTYKGKVPPLTYPWQDITWLPGSFPPEKCISDGSVQTACMRSSPPGLTQPLRIGKLVHARGWAVRGSGRVELDLARRCGSLEFSMGLDASSPLTAGTKFDIYADGANIFSSSWMGPSTSERRLKVSLVGVKNLTLAAAGTTRAVADFGDPILACGALSPYLPGLELIPVSGTTGNVALPGSAIRLRARARTHNGTSIPAATFEWVLRIGHCNSAGCTVSNMAYRKSTGTAEVSWTMPQVGNAVSGCMFYFVRVTTTDGCGAHNMASLSLGIPGRCGITR